MSIMDIGLPDTEPRQADGLTALTPGQMARDLEAERIADRLTRTGEQGDGSEAVRVAAFNSYI
ncbi:hypothetical protein OHR68_10025 [Spirillospora sp. NBC_00431]